MRNHKTLNLNRSSNLNKIQWQLWELFGILWRILASHKSKNVKNEKVVILHKHLLDVIAHELNDSARKSHFPSFREDDVRINQHKKLFSSSFKARVKGEEKSWKMIFILHFFSVRWFSIVRWETQRSAARSGRNFGRKNSLEAFFFAEVSLSNLMTNESIKNSPHSWMIPALNLEDTFAMQENCALYLKLNCCTGTGTHPLTAKIHTASSCSNPRQRKVALTCSWIIFHLISNEFPLVSVRYGDDSLDVMTASRSGTVEMEAGKRLSSMRSASWDEHWSDFCFATSSSFRCCAISSPFS